MQLYFLLHLFCRTTKIAANFFWLILDLSVNVTGKSKDQCSIVSLVSFLRFSPQYPPPC